MSRRPRYRLNQRALFWWLLIGMSTDEVVSALLMRALVDDTRGWVGTVVFFAVFATIGAIILAVGERVLPVEREKPQEGQ